MQIRRWHQRFYGHSICSTEIRRKSCPKRPQPSAGSTRHIHRLAIIVQEARCLHHMPCSRTGVTTFAGPPEEHSSCMKSACWAQRKHCSKLDCEFCSPKPRYFCWIQILFMLPLHRPSIAKPPRPNKTHPRHLDVVVGKWHR